MKSSKLTEGVHYIMDGNRVVFTALFHIKRGFCCGNKCRHCPYLPKHEKNNTKMDLNLLEQLRKQAESLESNNNLSIDEKRNEAIKLFEQLNEILSKNIENEQE